MLFLRGGVLLGAEADDRQQVFDLAEHPLLDDFAQFLITGPRWVAAMVPCPRAKCELHYLVTEVLGIGDARWLLDL